MIRKKRRTAGFSLAEMLLTVLLMGIVLSGLTAAIAAAVNVYNKARIRAEAEVLLSTTADAIIADLAAASEIEPKSGGAITSFYSSERGYRMMYINAPASDSDKYPHIEVGMTDLDEYKEFGRGLRLISSGAQPFGIYPKLEGPIYHIDTSKVPKEKTISFKISIYSSSGTELIKDVEYYVRPVTNN